MAVYLLDRNIVVDIEQHLKHGIETPELQRAREIDVENNLVSPLLAVMEGMFGARQDESQMSDTLGKETQLLADFFKRAGTDAVFLQEEEQQFVNAFVEQGRKDYEKYSPLIAAYLGRLGPTPPPRQALGLTHWALTEARRHHVEVAHPIVLAAVGCIHGNAAARKILKPKARPELVTEKAVYGAYSDLLHISWLNRIRADLGPDVQFLTRDQYLESFMAAMRLKVAKMHLDFRRQEETTTTTVDLDWNTLVPNLVNQPRGVEHASHLFRRHHVAQRLGLAPFAHRNPALAQALDMALGGLH